MDDRQVTYDNLLQLNLASYKSGTDKGETYKTSFQTRVRDQDRRTMFFINYHVHQIPAAWRRSVPLPEYMITVDVQFESRNAGTAVNISFNPQGMTFTQVDELIERLWKTEGRHYD